MPAPPLLCCPASASARVPVTAAAALCPVEPRVPGTASGYAARDCTYWGARAGQPVPPSHPSAFQHHAPGAAPQSRASSSCRPPHRRHLPPQQSSGPVPSLCPPPPGAAQPAAACCTPSRSAQLRPLPSDWIRAVRKEKVLTAPLPLGHSTGATSSWDSLVSRQAIGLCHLQHCPATSAQHCALSTSWTLPARYRAQNKGAGVQGLRVSRQRALHQRGACVCREC